MSTDMTESRKAFHELLDLLREVDDRWPFAGLHFHLSQAPTTRHSIEGYLDATYTSSRRGLTPGGSLLCTGRPCSADAALVPQGAAPSGARRSHHSSQHGRSTFQSHR